VWRLLGQDLCMVQSVTVSRMVVYRIRKSVMLLSLMLGIESNIADEYVYLRTKR
jgi:hypothetical protein